MFLGRDGSKSPERFLGIFIDARLTEGFTHLRRVDLGIRFGHGRIAHNDARQRFRMKRCRDDRDEAAHAVADDDRVSADAGVRGNGHDLVRPTFEAVSFTPSAIAMA
jgi:hypothetical protein